MKYYEHHKHRSAARPEYPHPTFSVCLHADVSDMSQFFSAAPVKLLLLYVIFVCLEAVPVSHSLQRAESIDTASRNFQMQKDCPEYAVHTATGVPVEEYFQRASEVYRYRVLAWSQGIGLGRKCSLRGPRCSLGLLCLGLKKDKKCMKPAKDGEPCNGSTTYCQQKSVCYKGICLKKAKHGEYCNNVTVRCSSFLFCSKNVCVKKRKENEYCSPLYPCKDAFVCDSGTCRTKEGKGVGAQCDLKKKLEKECKRGLLCAVQAYESHSTCTVPVEKAISCKIWCDGYHECIGNICWKVLSKNDYCMGTRYAICKKKNGCKKDNRTRFWKCK